MQHPEKLWVKKKKYHLKPGPFVRLSFKHLRMPQGLLKLLMFCCIARPQNDALC